MKFWFAFPLMMLMLSPIWLERIHEGRGGHDDGLIGVSEGGIGVPPEGGMMEGGIGVPPRH